MADFYPLRFQPIFRRYLWGGRRLSSVLSRPIGDGEDYAESWEVSDHGDDQSVVADGPLAGRTLHQLLGEHGSELLGRHYRPPGDRALQFPLLFKFLDAQRNLSLQVHPNDAQAARLDPPDLGKTEAWVILARTAGSKIYAGLKRGIDRHALERELGRGNAELCLNVFEPEVGDCIFLPAGVVHAIGEGLLVAEIQQASDTTYRVYDWNRLTADGQLRELHVDEALEVVDFDYGPVQVQTPQPTDRTHVERLVDSDKFVLDRWRFDAPQTAGGDDRCHIVAVIEGQVSVAGDVGERPLSAGSVVLLPAAAGEVQVTPQAQAVLLDMYLP